MSGLPAEACGNQSTFALRASVDAPSHASQAKAGGANRDRTDDLKLAKLALSQLSYGPVVNLAGSARELRSLGQVFVSSPGSLTKTKSGGPGKT